MVQIIPQSTPYGRLAENFGRSLGESFGKESQRQMTVSGVKNLAEQAKASGITSQFDLMNKLNSIPGMTPELMKMYQPAIMEAMMMQDRKDNFDDNQGNQGAQFQTEDNQFSSNQESIDGLDGETSDVDQASDEVSTLVTEADVASRLKQKIVPTPEMIKREGYKRYKKSQARYGYKIENAEQEYKDSVVAENAQIDEEVRISNVKDKLTQETRDQYDTKLANKLQTTNKQEQWQQLPGTLKDTIANKVLAEVKKGSSPEAAADKAASETVRIVEQIADFRELPGRSLFGRGSPEVIKRLEGYRDVFDKLNALPEYVALLKEKDFGTHMAHAIAYPASIGVRQELAKLQGNAKKTWKETIKSGMKSLIFPEMAILPEVKSAKQIETESNKSIEFAKNLADKLTPKDSIYTSALALTDAGFPDQPFYDQLKQLEEDDAISLTEKQRSELMEGLPAEASLIDMWYSATSGILGQKGRHSIYENILRAWNKR